MGWIAAGCCSLIFAGFLFYRFSYQAGTRAFTKGEDPAENDIRAHTLVQNAPAEEAQIAKKSDSERTRSVVLQPQITMHSVDNQTDQIDQPKVVTRTPPSISMPPPPMPRPNRAASPPRLKPPTAGGLAVPPRPGNGFVRPPPSAAASLRVPVTKPVQNAAFAPTSSIMPPGKQVSRKVILEPGHSPLDWAALANNPKNNMRGRDAPGERMLRITPSQLKAQNGRKGKDAWTVYQGKVYNITPYVPFHPGGAGEILRGAGKDSVKLFMEVHPWVNWDGMLNECLVGILVSEEEQKTNNSGGLDDMD